MAGEVLTIDFAIGGVRITALNGGPEFTPTPMLSFIVNFDPSQEEHAAAQLDKVWNQLSRDGKVLMELGEYPFSKRYGWVQDKFGVSWQLMLTDPTGEPRISGPEPFLTAAAEIGVVLLLLTLGLEFSVSELSSSLRRHVPSARIATLGWFVVTVLLGLAIHMFGVYSLSVWLLSRINPLTFFRRIKTAMITAFSTSSSNATLPTALRVSEENLGVPRDINSFVLTVGATANQNGTALYEGVTVLFLAQLAGIDLTMGQQLMVVYLAILGGVGTAGVPSGSIPFTSMKLFCSFRMT